MAALAFVSLVSLIGSQHPEYGFTGRSYPSPWDDAESGITVRALVQGSGTVITYPDPSKMLPFCPKHSAGIKGQDCKVAR
jgi:hypothetical protein